MQCRTRTVLELSRTRRSADNRYYYETPKFDSAHAECESVCLLVIVSVCVAVCLHICLSLSACMSVCVSCSSETSSYSSECRDDEEIALAIHAAEMTARNEARSRFKNAADLIHRLFVCISGHFELIYLFCVITYYMKYK